MSQLNVGTLNVATVDFSGNATTMTSADIGTLIGGSPSQGEVLEYTGSQWSVGTPSGVPAGCVFYIAASSAPTGFLKCNGANVSRSTYSNLFAALGTTYGNGDGSSTFGLPDLRGEFLRCWDDSRGVDSGRQLNSSTQGEMINQHKHWISSMATDDRNITGTGGNGQEYGLVSDASSYDSNDRNKSTGRYTRNDPGFNSNNETRPRNIAMLAVIKF